MSEEGAHQSPPPPGRYQRRAEAPIRNQRLDFDLTIACYEGDLSEVRRLVKAGANVTAFTPKGNPLGAAAYMGHLDVLMFLRKMGAEIYNDHRSPLFLPAQYGRAEVIRYLRSEGASPFVSGPGGKSPIAQLAESNVIRSEEVRRDTALALLEGHPRYFEEADSKALVAPALRGDLPLLELFLEHGARVRMHAGFRGLGPISAASSQWQIDAVVCLLGNNADANEGADAGTTALMRTAMGPGDRAREDAGVLVATTLLDADADPNVQSHDVLVGGITRSTALMLAIERRNFRVASVIANSEKTRLDLTDSSGLSALDWALLRGAKDLVAKFVARGVPLPDTKEGRTRMLRLAKGHPETVRYLKALFERA